MIIEGWYAPARENGGHATHAHFFRKEPDTFRPRYMRSVCRNWSIDGSSSRWRPEPTATLTSPRCETCKKGRQK